MTCVLSRSTYTAPFQQFSLLFICCLTGRGTTVKGRGSTPSRGGTSAAAKARTGGIRGKTSPTKPAGAPARGAARGGGKAAAGKTTGMFITSLPLYLEFSFDGKKSLK